MPFADSSRASVFICLHTHAACTKQLAAASSVLKFRLVFQDHRGYSQNMWCSQAAFLSRLLACHLLCTPRCNISVQLVALNDLEAVLGVCTGTLLRSLTFPSAIHSIRTDPGDHALYAGSGDGRIFETSLVGEGVSNEGSDEQREAGYYTMEGQNGAVTCLAMTIDANLMLSGRNPVAYSDNT